MNVKQKQASGIEHVHHIDLDALHSVLLTKQVFLSRKQQWTTKSVCPKFCATFKWENLIFQSLNKLREERLETICIIINSYADETPQSSVHFVCFWLLGIMMDKFTQNLKFSDHLSPWWRVTWCFIIHKTLLELHSTFW